MRKIRWFVRRKKAFDFRIRSDGVSVSLQYISPHSDPEPMNLDKVREKYLNRVVKNALGIDPGLNKWASVVQRNIETGAEVKLFLQSLHCFYHFINKYNHVIVFLL